MRRGPFVAAVLAATLLLTACSPGPAGEARLPDVSLEGLGGDPAVDLGELRGPALVNLWASWCVPCKKELPVYAAFAEKYDGRVAVLGVNWQETRDDAALRLLERSGVTFPNVADPDGRFRAIALPKLLLVDADGVVVYDEYQKVDTVAEVERLVAEHLGVS